MTSPVVGLVRRFGEVPPAGTDDRRTWLLNLPDSVFMDLTRGHGETATTVFDVCMGWGAVGAGLAMGELPPRCVRCNQPAPFPLWYTDGAEVWPRCWKCSAIDHLTECDMWI